MFSQKFEDWYYFAISQGHLRTQVIINWSGADPILGVCVCVFRVFELVLKLGTALRNKKTQQKQIVDGLAKYCG